MPSHPIHALAQTTFDQLDLPTYLALLGSGAIGLDARVKTRPAPWLSSSQSRQALLIFDACANARLHHWLAPLWRAGARPQHAPGELSQRMDKMAYDCAGYFDDRRPEMLAALCEADPGLSIRGHGDDILDPRFQRSLLARSITCLDYQSLRILLAHATRLADGGDATAVEWIRYAQACAAHSFLESPGPVGQLCSDLLGAPWRDASLDAGQRIEDLEHENDQLAGEIDMLREAQEDLTLDNGQLASEVDDLLDRQEAMEDDMRGLREQMSQMMAALRGMQKPPSGDHVERSARPSSFPAKDPRQIQPAPADSPPEGQPRPRPFSPRPPFTARG